LGLGFFFVVVDSFIILRSGSMRSGREDQFLQRKDMHVWWWQAKDIHFHHHGCITWRASSSLYVGGWAICSFPTSHNWSLF
jgi:hypothetical protein